MSPSSVAHYMKCKCSCKWSSVHLSPLASHPISPPSLLLEHNKCASGIITGVGICDICQARLWPLEDNDIKKKKKKKNTVPLLPLSPSPYIGGATWNCLKRWAVIKYCRADIMTGKIKERKQKKKRPDQFSSHNASPSPQAQPASPNKRHQATDRALVSYNFAAVIWQRSHKAWPPHRIILLHSFWHL